MLGNFLKQTTFSVTATSLFFSSLVGIGVPNTAFAQNIVPTGKCSFTVASRRTLPEVRSYISNKLHSSHRRYLRVVRTDNGWYAITVGDVSRSEFDTIKRKLVSRGEVPSDSFCLNGEKYAKVVRESEYRSAARTEPRTQQVSASGRSYIKVPGSKALMRKGPGKNFSSYGTVKHGQPVQILEVSGSWRKIRLLDWPHESVAWIHEGFIVSSQEELKPRRSTDPDGDMAAAAVVAGAALGVGLIACSLGGVVGANCFGNKKASSSKITFRNSCSRDDVKIYVKYLDTDDRWRTRGPWTFEYGERANLASNGDTLWTKNAIIYYYAETLDGDVTWEGSQRVEYGDDDLYMREYKTSSDTINVDLVCE